jgi:hypothetical protein
VCASHQPIRSWRGGGQVLGQSLGPPDVADPLCLGGATALGKHLRVWVKADHLLEELGEADGKDPGAAAGIQKPTAPIEAVSRASAASSSGE